MTSYPLIAFMAALLLANFSPARQADARTQRQRDTPRLFTFEENDAYGYEDAAGNVVIRPQFSLAWDFSEGLAHVQMCSDYGDRWGFIDATGSVAVHPRFENAHGFSEGLAAVRLNGRWGFINRRGRVIVKPRFDDDNLHDYRFSEGLAAVKMGKKWGFIDRRGRWVVRPRFDSVGDFSEGLAEIEMKDRHGYIDAKGRVVIEPRFDLAAEFSEGLARVNIGYRFGWNDEDTNRRKGKWGYIDRTGKFVIPAMYDWADSFSEGLAVVGDGGYTGFIAKTGRVRVEMKYEDARAFSEGLAAVRLDRKWGYINPSGGVVIPFRFGESWSLSGGVAVVNNGFNRINSRGEVIWERKPAKRVSTASSSDCEPRIKPPSPTPAELARRRQQVYKLIFDGQYQHDGAGELLYIGDMTSVPALLRVLKDNAPKDCPGGRCTYVCTYAHAVAALEKITGHKAVHYQDWAAWWGEHQKSHPR